MTDESLPLPSSEPPAPRVGSPVSSAALLDLYFRPSRFFAEHAWLRKTPELVLAALLLGIASAIDRIDTNMMKADLNPERDRMLVDWVSQSWTHYWMVGVGFGAIGAVMLWYVGGWWYGLRLRWAGASQVTSEDARPIYVYVGLTTALPFVLVAQAQTLIYSDYRTAWTADEVWTGIVALVAMFWSCVVSYRAASSFPVKPWPARLWFLILPALLYVFALGAVTAIYTMIEPGGG